MIHKYDVFLHVMEAGSLTTAAEQIGYTQSAVSQIISSLESELGFPLLHRGKDGVTPTREAAQLVPYMREIIRQDELLRQEAASVRDLQIGVVRIGVITSVAQYWLPKMISEFETIYPGIELQLKVAAYQEIEGWLLDGSVDCGFITSPKKTNLQFNRLAYDKMLVVLPAKHPLTTWERFPIKSILDEPFIMPSEGSGHDIGRILRDTKVKPRVRFAVNDDYVAIAMVRAGIGITILPELLLRDKKGGLCAKELDPPQRRQLGIAVSSKRKLSPAAELFLHFVQDPVNITNS